MTREQALKLRKALKARKPDFVREDYQKRACIPMPWRRPRGLHSKMRHRFAGHRALVDPSYGSPKEAYGLHPSGFEPVLVHTLNELLQINPKLQGAVLGSTLGMPRRIALLEKAKELGVRVLNVKNIDDELRQIRESIAARKEAKTKAAKEKEAKAKEKEAKAKKPALTEKVSEEEQKKKAKEEKDKVLTARQS
ncbi:MAG: 50S ribosomal protein L32e [Candidatus Woesearchaeota archaeon]